MPVAASRSHDMSDHAVILLAEDREDDILLIRRAFNRARIVNPLCVVRDGEEAVAYLKGEGRFANRTEFPPPGLLLLDLKMPRMDGFEVLRWVRQQPNLRALRIVVLTSSEHTHDLDLAYKLGASSFLVKPAEFEHFVDLSHALSRYWIWINRSSEISRHTPCAQPAPDAVSKYQFADSPRQELLRPAILLVTNEEEDIALIRHTLEKTRLVNSLHIVRSGEDALAYLNGEDQFCDREQYPLPELLLLDLNLSPVDAFVLLRALRQQSRFNNIPVMVLASSGQTREINLAFQAGANSFMFKPVRTQRFLDTIMSMNGCWLSVDTPQVRI